MPRVWGVSVCGFVHLGLVVACLTTEGDASMTAGRCQLSESVLPSIFARGDCPNYNGATACPDEVGPCSGTCQGNVFNPKQDCLAGCTECENGCVDSCEDDAIDLCGGDEGCIEVVMEVCVPNCQSNCPCNCASLPDEDRKVCNNTIPRQSQYTLQRDIGQTVTKTAENSNYKDIPTVEFHCFIVTDCGTYCRVPPMGQNYACKLGDPRNDDTPYNKPDPEESPTEGECPDDE